MQQDDTTQDTGQQGDIRDQLLDAALMHVAFDGWSETTFRAAVEDAGIDPGLARAICPRGSVDLAMAYHRRGDLAMAERLKITDLTGMRYRDKVALAVRFRLEAATDKEAVRRGATLFALPQHAADGAKLIWGTADAIWTALGDTSEDGNWYSKRATLSAVYSSVVLYWLGDDSPESAATWAFLDRRIDDVMRVESFKQQARRNPLLKPFMIGPDWLAKQIKAPKARPEDLPGSLG
ncbi:COQ9 family protein [Pseudodonghicola flavimaris]|uniref:COQ9 family protein n=1 Tax=Pseudodonghicola flavimaris TaxID=3050036 RepID=A0ABT7EYF2_9RHOB|nr:COQ9 family protein [Pseudodonghicola flavimaris]MDK3017371.1 COQ9 family protein [Pseudodonghicola flavimaris]